MTSPDTDIPIRHYRPFVLFWCARVSASLALQMQVVAVGWQVYEMTGSALDLGLVGLSQFVPAFLLVLVAGAVADRYDRSRVVRLAQLTEGCAALLLAIGTYYGFLTRDTDSGAGLRARRRPRLRGADPAGAAAAAGAAAGAAARGRGLGLGEPDRNRCRSRHWRAALCRQPDAGLFAVRRPVHRCRDTDLVHPRRAGGAEAREGRLRRLVRRHRLHPEKSADPRRHLARHVRGAVCRRDRACCRSTPRTFFMSAPGGLA